MSSMTCLYDAVKICAGMPIYMASRAITRPILMPALVAISLTGECYSRCKTCNIWKFHKENPLKKKEELGREEWGRVFKSIRKGPIWFSITGGEPFLKKDMAEIIISLSKNCRPAYISIATSGIYPRKTYEEVLKITKGLVGDTRMIINISLDGIGEDYWKIRGIKDGHLKAKETLNMLKGICDRGKASIKIGINTVISDMNYDKIGWLIEFVKKEYSPDSHIFEVFSKKKSLYLKGDSKKLLERHAKPIEEAKNARLPGHMAANLLRRKYYSVCIDRAKGIKNLLSCYSLYASCFISPYGEVASCPVRYNLIGDLKKEDYDFSRIWHSKTAKAARKKIREENCQCEDAGFNYVNILMGQFF